MAQKQYSFDFVLNAVLNGGFSGTFTKAQQEFIRLGNEIKNLQAIQRDIAAYQKQQQAVQNTTGKLENLKKQYELINKQISETTGSTTALEREKLKLEQRITSTEAALEKQRAKLNDTKERLDAAGVSTDDLAGKDAALTEKIKELTEEQKKAAEGAKEFANASVEAIQGVADAVAAAGIAKAVKGIADAYSECVGVAGDFEQAMSAVEAIAEANNREMTALTAEAKELGATTIYTAQKSANAMEYMAMAGWDAQEMLAGMKGVTTLAAAAGEDLAQVSDIVTDGLSGFKLRASDTAHFVDVLAAAATKSNTNISIMGETFKSSSSVAGALEYSIEDVAVMIGLMANAAVKGSRAGTALRNIFDGLLGSMTLTAKAFGEVEYSAVNSDGSMKGLVETVKDLRFYFDQMTQSEQVKNAKNIAGMRGYNGLLAILNATDEDFQRLYASINNCSGAAERMASVKLDNLNGDVTIMNSAMEALQNTIGEQFNPELRELARTGTEVLNWANGFIQENPALVKGVMAGGAAFVALGTAIVGVNAAIKVFQALNLASLFTSAGPLLAVAGGIATVAATAVGMNEALRDGGPEVRELTVAAREANAALEESKVALEDTTASSLAAADVAIRYIGKLEEMGDAANLSADGQKEYQNTLALLLQVMPSLSGYISKTTDEYGRMTYALETDTDALYAHVEAQKENAKAQAYQEYLNSLMEKYGDVLLEQAENEVKLTKARSEQEDATRRYNETVERMAELYREAEAAAKASNEEMVLPDEWFRLEESLKDIQREFDYAGAKADIFQAGIEDDAETIAAFEEELSFAEKTVIELLKALGLYTDEQENVKGQETTVQGVLTDTRTRLRELAEAYKDAYEAAKDSFEGQFGLFDEAKISTDATIANAQKALDSQLAYWKDYAANIAVLKETSAEELGITQENYDALMKYVQSGGPQAAGLAADMAKAVNDGNKQTLTNLAETMGEIDKYQDQIAQDMADWAVGLTEQMDGLIDDMREDIAALDLSKEAKKNAKTTIQAYIDAIEDMLPQVRNAYGMFARSAGIALGSPYTWYTGYTVNSDEDGYASGTDNAPPGWAWVGEKGPELMRMRGGEQILPAEASRRLAEDYSAYNRYNEDWGIKKTPGILPAIGGENTVKRLEIVETGDTEAGTGKVEMHFHIEAGASPETVNAWQEYARSGELKAAVLEVMEDAEADIRRRSLT